MREEQRWARKTTKMFALVFRSIYGIYGVTQPLLNTPRKDLKNDGSYALCLNKNIVFTICTAGTVHFHITIIDIWGSLF